MAIIKVNFDGLEQQAGNIANQIQSYEALNTRATNMINQISSSWQGEAATAYIEKINLYLTEARKMVGVLEAFKRYANSSSAEFRELDQACANDIRNSF